MHVACATGNTTYNQWRIHRFHVTFKQEAISSANLSLSHSVVRAVMNVL